MRKLTSLLACLFIATALTASPARAGNSKVEFTWTFAALGQGAWGGGPLYADGSANGNLPFSAANGNLIYHLTAFEWSEPIPGFIDICFETRDIKGTAPFPPVFCGTDVGLSPLPVTGTPIVVDFMGMGDALIRVTPVDP